MFGRIKNFDPTNGVTLAVEREPGKYELILVDHNGITLFMEYSDEYSVLVSRMSSFKNEDEQSIWKITEFKSSTATDVVRQEIFDYKGKRIGVRGKRR